MTRKFLALILVLLLLVTLGGCAANGYYSPGRSAGAGTLGGAAVGAALGSIIGAATGSPATGAWIGAAAGAVVGGVGSYLYAQHKNSQIRDAQMAAQSYHYTPARGDFVAIERVAANPPSIRPGDQVNMETAFTVLTPHDQPVPVTITRGVKYGGSYVSDPNEVRFTKPNGTYVDQIALTIPRGAEPGTYTLITKVMAGGAYDEKTSYFSVVR